MQLRRDIVEQAREEIANPFALVNVVGKRARQLDGGAEPLVVGSRLDLEKPVMTALKEVAAGKLTIGGYTIVGRMTASHKIQVDGALYTSIDELEVDGVRVRVA